MHIRGVDLQRYLPNLAEVRRGAEAQQQAGIARQAFVSELTRQADEQPAALVERDDLVAAAEERDAGGQRHEREPRDEEDEQPANRRQGLTIEELASLMQLPNRGGKTVDLSA